MTCRRGALPPATGAATIDGNVPAPNDTHPFVARMIIEGFRRMSPSEKLQRVEEMTLAIQELALADVRRRYPDASEREQQLRLASRRFDRETMIRVFGWDPDQRGR